MHYMVDLLGPKGHGDLIGWRSGRPISASSRTESQLQRCPCRTES